MASAKKLIGEFFLELSKDKHASADYADNREAVLAKSGLTKEQQEIVLSDDLEKIRDEIREEYQSAKVIVLAMFVGVGRPKS